MTRFLFYVPDNNEPSGGVNVIFDLVQTLSSNGIEAFVISSNPTFRYDYLSRDPDIFFAPQIREKRGVRGQVRLLSGKVRTWRRNPRVALRRDDIIVVPEYVSAWLPQRFPDNRCILLNQNFYSFGVTTLSNEWKANRFAATVSISNACHEFARLSNVKRPVVIPLVVHGHGATASVERKKIISYMPRRRPLDVRMVVKLLVERGLVKDFELRPLDRISRDQVAQALRESSIFLSFSELEGFGLPPAEAMLAGCVVVGYTGVAGAEFLDEDVGFPVEDGNISVFVQTVEDVAERCRRGDGAIEAMRIKASARIAENYSLERHEAAVMKAFGELAATVGVGQE
jgi:glycosyltransferase involved in cell wall biosynthesis